MTLADAALAPLFQPVQLGAFGLPNRMLMAPMTRSRANAELAVHDLHVDYYRQRSTAGLIVTEGTQVSAEGIGYIATPGVHTDAQIAGWREVTTGVHAAGGRILAQLWHVGRISHSDLLGGQPPVAPSALAAEGQAYTFEGPKPLSTPRALSTDEVVRVIEDFAHGARRAKEAGFDGVQIHGANGYLVDQFLRDSSNQRTDRYGGSLSHRLRFLTELTEAVVAVWGADRVSVRLSPGNNPFNSQQDSDPAATFGAAAAALSHFKLAYLEGVDFGGPANPASLHGVLRDAFKGPYVANGGFTPGVAAGWLREGRAHAISFGSLFISNPDLPERVRRGAPLLEADRATFYGGAAAGYTDYPSIG
jgi:N-ethylmaleimide reductase